MEQNLSVREVLSSIANQVNSNHKIKPELKKPLNDLNQKYTEDNTGKKVNLTLFGALSSGKTTLINLMIRHLKTQRTNRPYSYKIDQNQIESNITSFDTLNLEEEEEEYDGFVTLPTKDIENTYFIYFIESSDTEAYEIILDVNSENDRKALLTIKELKNLNNDNKFTLKFSNDRDGIKSMNKFLEKIDYKCLNLISNLRKSDLDEKQGNPQEFTPSKIIIKIPDFPNEYRIIDCPGLSIESFRKAFIKMINDLNYINFFLILNDILARESYTLTEDILKEVGNDYGSPILYSFVTKGNKFLIEFPKINSNYKASVRINNIKFQNLDHLKSKIHFRKVRCEKFLKCVFR